MKIILFTDNLGPGGAQRQLVGLAKLLVSKGYTVKVCTYQDVNFYKSYLDDLSIDNEVIPGADNKLHRIPRVVHYFKKEAPDYIIAYQEIPSLILAIARILGCRAKSIVSERNTTQHITIKDWIRFNLYRLVDYIVPNSYSQERFLIEHHKWMSDKICTITNFVDVDAFSFNYSPLKEKPLIVVAASIWPPKNVKGLVEAIKVLAAKKYKFKVEWYGLVAGHDQYVEECQQLIRKYSIEEYIQLCPKTKEIKSKYIECDFFCLPSFYEGTPNVICEAMSVGRPVLCSNVCDNSRYITDGENGFLFDPKSIDDIAHQFETALAMSEDQHREMCYRNRRKAEELLSTDTFINKYLNLLIK